MKTADAVARAKGRNNLAKILGITGSAISQWGDTMPELRYWQLKAKKPHWFRGQARKQEITAEAV